MCAQPRKLPREAIEATEQQWWKVCYLGSDNTTRTQARVNSLEAAQWAVDDLNRDPAAVAWYEACEAI